MTNTAGSDRWLRELSDNNLCLTNKAHNRACKKTLARRNAGTAIQRQDGCRRENQEPGCLHERQSADNRCHIRLRHGSRQKRCWIGDTLRHLRLSRELCPGSRASRQRPASECKVFCIVLRQRSRQTLHPSKPDKIEHQRNTTGMESRQKFYEDEATHQLFRPGNSAAGRLG